MHCRNQQVHVFQFAIAIGLSGVRETAPYFTAHAVGKLEHRVIISCDDSGDQPLDRKHELDLHKGPNKSAGGICVAPKWMIEKRTTLDKAYAEWREMAAMMSASARRRIRSQLPSTTVGWIE